MGGLGPDCEYITVADSIGSVPVQGERVIGLPLAAHVEGISAADVEDNQIEWGVLLPLLPYLCQRGMDEGVGLGRSALREEVG